MSGRLTADDVAEYVERTYRPNPFLRATNVLIDMRELDAAPCDEELAAIAELIGSVAEQPMGTRRAVVADDGECLRAAARFAASLPCVVGREVFADVDSALDWLLEQHRDVLAQRRRYEAA